MIRFAPNPMFFICLLIIPFVSWNFTFAENPPNSLTPEEISEGWILLFDGESLFGWISEDPDAWIVANGSISTATWPKSGLLTTTEFSNYVLRFQYRIKGGGDLKLEFQVPDSGHSYNQITEKDAKISASGWQVVEYQIKGNKVYRNNPLSKKHDNTAPIAEVSGKRGKIRISYGFLNMQAELRNIKLLPLNTKPIFNGKNLDGWNILPDRQSQFTVTPEGELNIKNGNGQIETAGQWADFILQMDIRTNGDHLNSGVFFRGNPGAFWSGYESQIRNQWEGEDRTKPVDFGTGGIYGRQPARKVVSSDREWFTKTIVACGNHIAVWVNGYQVSDFTDTREQGRNAREQRRLQAGTISLQGHDPTTDLSFRNIRLAEYE